MLAIGRGLMAEPCLGLSPFLVKVVMDIINNIYKELKITTVLVEETEC